MIESKIRNYGFDSLKLICAFLVVCIHAPFPETVNYIITPIARIAVPIFFMISGYFYSKEQVKKQVTKIFKLIIISNFIYFVYDIATSIIKGNLLLFFQKTFNITNLIDVLLFNISPFSDHLWYLNASLYTIIIISFIKNKIKTKKIYLIIPILLICDLIFGKYSIAIFNEEFPYIYVRNFLCVGIPYFLLGNLLSDYKEKINIPRFNLHILITIFAITTLLEKIILIHYNVNATRDHYISTTFLSVFVFLLFAIYANRKNIYSNLGKKYSTFVYLYHPLILNVFIHIMGGNYIYQILAPVLIFVSSIFCAIIYEKIKIRLKKKVISCQNTK